MMEEDGFKLVRHRKKPGRRKGRKFLERIVDSAKWNRRDKAIYDLNESIRIDTTEELQEQIEKCRIELRGGYLEMIVCYGLGNFTLCCIALYQLALLVAMKDELRFSDRVVIYDPCFTDLELKALPSFGFHLLQENTECHYPVTSGRTLFFMPHMYREHYNNVLKSNWHQLELIRLYCNSFEAMMRPESVLKLRADSRDGDYEYLFKLADGHHTDYQMKEQRVRNEFHDSNVFNDLAILTFTKKK